MMLASLPVPAQAVTELARMIRTVGADELADRLERALDDEVKVLGLESDERGIILGELEDPPEGLAELRAVLLNEDQWRRREGLDAVSSRLRREERSVVAGRLIHGPKLTIGARRALRGDLRPFAVCRRAPR